MGEHRRDAGSSEPERSGKFWVHDLSWDGRGVAKRADGRVVMIMGALPGDTILAHVDAEPKKGPLHGVLDEVLDPAPQRVPHPCPHYGEGCPASLLGAVRREFSLEWKRDHLVETFRRIGGLRGLVVEEVIPSPRQWRYRDRLEFQIRRVDGVLRTGYGVGKGLLPVTDCRLGAAELREPHARLSEALAGLDLDHRIGGTVNLRLLLRTNGRDGVVAVLFVITTSRFDASPLEKMLDGVGLAGWQIRRSTSVKNRFFASRLLAEGGDPLIYHPVAGRSLITDPTVFTQANPKAASLLMQVVTEQLPKDGNLIDLYGGFGAFAFEHVDRGGKATVVESSPSAVNAGKLFAESNNLPVSFQKRDLGRGSLEDLDFDGFDCAVLDPPRSGADEPLLARLDKDGPERVVYVSCHPAALARDLRRMTAYHPRLIVPVDLFPSTSDLETIAILDRM